MAYGRKTPRFLVNFGGAFAGEYLAGQGTITNLSVAGCGIESTITLTVQSPVGLHLQIPNSRRPLQIERAVVRWVRGKAFGLEFETMSATESRRLEQLIRNLEQKPLVGLHHPPPKDACSNQNTSR